jgi:peptidyl-prolyl cis-trans isomerase C
MVKFLVASLPVLLLFLIALPAKAEDDNPVVTEPEDYLMVKLGDEEIYYREVQQVWQELFPGEGKAPALAGFGDNVRDNIVRGIITERLMVKEAKKQNLGESPELKEQLELLKQKLMVKALLEKQVQKVSEEDVKARYDEVVEKASGKEEVHASHILVESEEDAEKLYEKLKEGGADFAQEAKEISTDKGTAVNGGDLGYFAKEQMVPEFAEAAFALKKGELSKPVKSSFGWHIIKVHDRRPIPVPTLEESYESIKKSIAREASQQYILDLMKNADFTYYGPDGEELPLDLDDTAKLQ